MRKARRPLPPGLESRVLAGRAYNEDAAVLAVPPGMAIVQTTDVLGPIVNDARNFGRIAAANALSDVYAMGGEPWCAMCLAFFPACLSGDDADDLPAIIEGALATMEEAGAAPAGGHTVQDDELKFGLAVTGVIDPLKIARNNALRPGDTLILTKPLGVGILATGVKARWNHAAESEEEIIRWCGKLNSAGAQAIRRLDIAAATDITGFGLGGHSLEMARASNAAIEIAASALPILPNVLDYAADGLIPAGAHANQAFCAPDALWPEGMDKELLSVVFDPQTSGGLLLAVPGEKISEARRILLEHGDLAVEIGRAASPRSDGKRLIINP